MLKLKSAVTYIRTIVKGVKVRRATLWLNKEGLVYLKVWTAVKGDNLPPFTVRFSKTGIEFVSNYNPQEERNED